MRRIVVVLLLSFAVPFAAGVLCDARCTSADRSTDADSRTCHRQAAEMTLSQAGASDTGCHRAVAAWRAVGPQHLIPTPTTAVAPAPAASWGERPAPLTVAVPTGFASDTAPPIVLPLRI
jgi:hypothetical protein